MYTIHYTLWEKTNITLIEFILYIFIENKGFLILNEKFYLFLEKNLLFVKFIFSFYAHIKKRAFFKNKNSILSMKKNQTVIYCLIILELWKISWNKNKIHYFQIWFPHYFIRWRQWLFRSQLHVIPDNLTTSSLNCTSCT